MFKSAYLRLTVYYVIILLAISLACSAWIYRETSNELRTNLERSARELEDSPFGPALNRLQRIREQQLQASHVRLQLQLLYFNLGVLAIGAVGCYMLAKRTMQPIEEAMQAQNRFTADASHELRTPLTAMKTEIEVALRDKKLSRNEAIALLKSNLDEIDHLTNLSEGLLTLAASHEVNLEPVQIHTVVKEVAERLQPLATAKQVQLQCNVKSIEVLADAQNLEKVVRILLDNAIKYTSANTTVKIGVFKKSNMAVLRVTDQGYGIKATDLPHIFDRFYRADTSRSKEKINGYGLGLAIAKKIVTNLQGTITVKSTLNKGSTFEVRLPIEKRTKD